MLNGRIFLIFTAFILLTGPLSAKTSLKKEQVLPLLLKQKLEYFHYSKKIIDDKFSRDAFNTFLERLDYEKRFLLQSDVAKLSAFKEKIDDEIRGGQLKFYKAGYRILKGRIAEVHTLATKILSHKFDLNKAEFLETDSKKRSFPQTVQERNERWRKLLKYSVENQYITESANQKILKTENEKTKGKKPKDKTQKKEKLLSADEIEKKAREEMQKTMNQLFDRLEKQDDDDYLDMFINAFASVFDPHTSYFAPDKKEDFDIEMRGSLEGIGALLREDGPYIKVVQIIPGSASWRQGELKAEDIILKVGQAAQEPVNIVNVRVRDAVKLIRGKKGTEVRLTVRKPTGVETTVPITRDVVKLEETFAKGTILENNGKKQGYIHLPKFYRDFGGIRTNKNARNSTDDIRKELQVFVRNKVDGVVLDLRYNGGGALEDARQISGLFIKEGPIVQVKRSNGQVEVLKDRDDTIVFKGPVVVLINQFSASASEILAAALQDYKRAFIVGGNQSHGKGTVQILLDLDQGLPDQYAYLTPLGALKVTIQKFYRINGGSTQEKGVIPDIILPLPSSYMDSNEKNQPFSLKWDSVKALKYEIWPQYDREIWNRVKANSLARTKENNSFKRIKKSVEILRKRRETTRVSLRLDDLLQEQKIAKEEAKKLSDISPDLSEADDNYGAGDNNNNKQDIEKESHDLKLSKKRKHDRWLNRLHKDPVVSEAMAILDDYGRLTKPGVKTK